MLAFSGQLVGIILSRQHHRLNINMITKIKLSRYYNASNIAASSVIFEGAYPTSPAHGAYVCAQENMQI